MNRDFGWMSNPREADDDEALIEATASVLFGSVVKGAKYEALADDLKPTWRDAAINTLDFIDGYRFKEGPTNE